MMMFITFLAESNDVYKFLAKSDRIYELSGRKLLCLWIIWQKVIVSVMSLWESDRVCNFSDRKLSCLWIIRQKVILSMIYLTECDRVCDFSDRRWSCLCFFWQKVIVFVLSHVGLTSLVGLYAVAGGFIFQRLERNLGFASVDHPQPYISMAGRGNASFIDRTTFQVLR